MFYDLLVSPEAREMASSLGFKTYDSLVLDHTEVDRAYSYEKVVFVRSANTLEKNKRIVRMPIDVLLDPFFPRARPFDLAMLRIAKDNGVVIGVSINRFFRYKGEERARLLLNGRRLVSICMKVGAKILMVSGAEHPFDLRKPIQLASIGVLLGMDWNKAYWAIRETPEYLVRRKENGTSTNP